ncbi:hypothetical protein DL96DRAFT_1554174 [Flagelloscypha sp. PMI_526]|nr:hypothetical protein DL96DRAFT_1554174 [Flagelloscypha sp. PMI_526]
MPKLRTLVRRQDVQLSHSLSSEPEPESNIPINCLPRDLLIDIFALYINQAGSYIRAEPIQLSIICKRWRHILHETPSLWQKIFLSLDGSENPSLLPRLNLWIHYSRDAALDIKIHLRGKSSEQSFGYENWGRIVTPIKRLAAHSKRWRSLKFWQWGYLP